MDKKLGFAYIWRAAAETIGFYIWSDNQHLMALTLEIIIPLATILVGLYFILKGSEWITDAAVPLARMLNTTNTAIGLVLVSVLLSLPELFVALSAIYKGHTAIGIGTSIGSIIVNLGLIIGLAAITHPLKIPRHVITRDAVFMLIATIVVSLVALDDLKINQRDGFVFILLFIPYLINVYEQEKTLAARERNKESEMIETTLNLFGKISKVDLVIHDGRIVFFIGVVLLLFGSELFTSSLITISTLFGLPEFLIGVTIGALGPSIPNLAAAYQASKRGFDELVISETIGSNIFTLLITLGIIAVVSPITIDSTTANVTTPALLVITIIFFLFTLTGKISRAAGGVLLFIYLMTMISEFLVRF